ncbi:hypothetical protein PF010_g707 [Phytophthora fragariae]|uniref:Uncharacterized protein n=1 Tax=Phytophthora fragariae TaxID=53985 RepID=A0A6A4EZN5_9STRA|nr:hypothetical protein PF003_g19188 [Phytophthora fragariae]KAE8949850.1 hypothetical protein PF009_g608 [Phytophthora fragariae]KAE9139138.1 hypothetical protein PF010_g707 [Phytophthora fragariae]KAE9140446.1 hypothetical protein PF007_g641 [Phytophthora fragariae]KAE9153203.1 hypothetical protein PF006_g2648 [Phytophthora fragariae]
MRARDLKKLKIDDGDLCFFVNVASEKAARQLLSD